MKALRKAHLLVHATPLAGFPSYPLLHTQSLIVVLPCLLCPELPGQRVQDFTARPGYFLYVPGVQAGKIENGVTCNKRRI